MVPEAEAPSPIPVLTRASQWPAGRVGCRSQFIGIKIRAAPEGSPFPELWDMQEGPACGGAGAQLRASTPGRVLAWGLRRAWSCACGQVAHCKVGKRLGTRHLTQCCHGAVGLQHSPGSCGAIRRCGQGVKGPRSVPQVPGRDGPL